jgi:hypothetical protein
VKGVTAGLTWVGQKSGAFDVAAAINDGVQWACNNVFTPGNAATAASVGATIPSGYTQAAAVAAAGGAALCSMRSDGSSTSTSTSTSTSSSWRPRPKQAAAVFYPVGTIQWQDQKTGMWKLAVPVTAKPAAPAGLGAVPEYWRVATSDHPYLTATSGGQFGDAAPPYQITVSNAQTPNVTIVTQSEGEKATGTQPFYKKTAFWLIAGGAVAATTGAVIIVRRRRKHV